MDRVFEPAFTLKGSTKMSGGQTGMEIYRHIRKHHSTLPVLFMSGNIQFLESIRLLQKNHPHLDHVSKPCQSEDYLRSVNQLLQNDNIWKQKNYGKKDE
jgi:DNA-binding NtrC family response regulator